MIQRLRRLAKRSCALVTLLSSETPYKRLIAGAWFVAAIAAPALGGECPNAEQVVMLVERLGDEAFEVRQAATRELLNAGPHVVSPLQKAAAGSDLEVTVRSVALLQQLFVEAEPATSAAAGTALRALTSSPRPATAHHAHLALRYKHLQAVRKLASWGADVRHESRSADPQVALRISISERWQGGDSGLEHLANVENLKSLSLKRAVISADAAEYLPALAGLEWLSCEETAIGDAQLEAISQLKRLKRLYLGDSRVTGAGLPHLSGLVELEYLSLKNLRIASEDLRALTRLPKLDQLGLDETKLTDAGLAQAAEIPRLHTLWINRAQVTDEGLASLVKLEQLRTLYIADTKLTGSGLGALVGHNDLLLLSCTNAPIDDAGLEQIARFPNLENLVLDGTRITDDGLRHLCAMANLRTLCLRDTQITDAGLKHLHVLTNLSSLQIMRSKVTAAGVSELNEALPNLEIRR